MNNLSIPSKKEILNLLNNFNKFLANCLNQLKFDNIKKFHKNLIHDRRFIITFFVVLISIFAHLSAPAFYQDKWVLSKIKKQLENEFNLTFLLPEKVNYSMFPIPSFHLKNVEIIHKNQSLGKVNLVKLNLSYSKFFDKEKVNIQDVQLKNAKFEIHDLNIKDLLKFLDKEINKKKLYIENSQLFFKDKNKEVYAILSLGKSVSFFDQKLIKNFLNFEGEIFNIPINAIITNDYLKKKTLLKFELNKINKKINIDLNYLNDPNQAELEILDGSNSYLTDIKFSSKGFHFKTIEKNENKFSYNGIINFNPFSSNIQIKSKVFDLKNLINQNGLLLQIINSNILNNPNLNYKIDFSSSKIKNHRLLSDFVLCLVFNQKNFNFDGTKINFDNNVKIEIVESIYKSNEQGNVFSGKMIFLIEDENKLYKFFQTKKIYRKPLNKITFIFSYNFDKSELSVEELEINDRSNNAIKSFQKKYENKKFDKLRKLEIKNFFNELASVL